MINLPQKVISYYASSKGIDNRNCFNFWLRSKLIRVICDKPFARGDVLTILSIENTNSGLIINTVLTEEYEPDIPVLLFVSGRLIYDKNSKFVCNSQELITIVSIIEQTLADNYSIGFICLVSGNGKITASDNKYNNHFDIYINLQWSA